MRKDIVRPMAALALLLAAGVGTPAHAQTSPPPDAARPLPSREPVPPAPRDTPREWTGINVDGCPRHYREPVPTYFIIDGRRVSSEALASDSTWVDPADIASIRILKGRRAVHAYGRNAPYRPVVLIRTKSGDGPRPRPAGEPRSRCAS
jgi:hypothetical protein